MKPIFLNQDTRYGRALFSIEEGYLCVATGRGRSRREMRCRLDRIDPRIERRRQRFVGPALKNFATAASLIIFARWLIDRLKFVDDLLQVPVAAMYVYLFGGLLVGSLAFYSVIGLFQVDVVECRSVDGTFAVRLFQTKEQRQLVEDFVADLLRAIDAESKERGLSCQPGQAQERVRRLGPDSPEAEPNALGRPEPKTRLRLESTGRAGQLLPWPEA